MLIYPPVDKIIKKASCRYELVCAVSKRAREIISREQEGVEAKEKPITQAAIEIYEGKVEIISE